MNVVSRLPCHAPCDVSLLTHAITTSPAAPLPPRPLSTKTRAAMAVHALSLCRDEFTADPGDAARSSIDALCDALGCHGAWAWVAALGLVAASKEAIAEVRHRHCIHCMAWHGTVMHGAASGCDEGRGWVT